MKTSRIAFVASLVLAACGTGSPSPDVLARDGSADVPVATGDASPLDAPVGEDAVSPPADSPVDSSPPEAATADVPVAMGDASAPAPACTETVTDVAGFTAAVRRLGPGRVLCLAPGTYALPDRVRLDASLSGTELQWAVLRARDARGSVTLDARGAEEALWFNGAQYLEVRGLRVTGGGYHALKMDPPSAHLRVRDCELVGNQASGDTGSQLSAIKGYQVLDVLIEGNEIHETREWPGANLQGIDCNACRSWTVRGNLIHDIRAQSPSGTGVQFKSAARDTVIENNVIYGCSTLGISVGGFGSPMAWGLPPDMCENIGALVRNNVIYRCGDAAVSIVGACEARVAHNTMWGNGFTPDVRRFARAVVVENNVLDRRLNPRDGTAGNVTDRGNAVLSSPTQSEPFVDAAGGDFHLAPGAAMFIDRGVPPTTPVPADFEGDARPRGMGYDVGADER